MSIVAWLVLGAVVIGGALWLAGTILAGAAKAFTSIAVAMRDELGRKSAGARAAIPQELRADEHPLPRRDPDREGLYAYEPKPKLVKPPAPHAYTARSAQLFADQSKPSQSIDIDRITEILSMPSWLPYAPALSVLSDEPAYPAAAPQKPPAIEPPPIWTPWRPTLGDPAFTPPLWSGALAALNRFVIEAHQSEISAVEAARARKAELLKQCETRNQIVEALARKAQKAFESAQEEQRKSFDAALASYRRDAAAHAKAFQEEQAAMRRLRDEIKQPGGSGLLKRIEMSIQAMSLPPFVSREGSTRFDEESGIVIHEHRFPDVGAVEWTKLVELKAGLTAKAANQKERKEAAVRLHPALCLRLATEIARLDEEGLVKAVAINGWADYTEKATGQIKRAYCASLFATKEQISALRLSALDPQEAFAALKGVSARSMELTPIAPIMRLDTNDPRFIDAKEVLAKMAEGENLAAMPWDDFEHLCRELFERAFAGSGAEVKVTQASRDQGVDAVVFDPDPLRGGKLVIQAKRYTNTVDVSAVRDLYGAVINEGAVKGILVTTSHFGPEAYSFAKDKPITLLNGNELLGLLEKHGYKFRINLAEAKAMTP